MLGKTAVIKDRTTTLIEICEGRVRACLGLRVSLKVVLVWFLFLFFFFLDIVYSSLGIQVRGENYMLLLI